MNFWSVAKDGILLSKIKLQASSMSIGINWYEQHKIPMMEFGTSKCQKDLIK